MLVREEKALKEFQRQLLEKFNGEVLLIELFGSKVRDDDRVDSDIDTIVVTKTKDYEFAKEICGVALDISLEYDVDISPKIYSRKEFSELKKKDRSFIRNVMREGVILWQMS